MKRPKRYSGQHRAPLSPARATQVLTAAIILALIAVLVLIAWEIRASHKIGGSVNEAPPKLPQASAPAAPLGGDGKSDSGQASQDGSAATTHTLVDEPLLYETAEGGGKANSQGDSGSSAKAAPAPLERDRQAIEYAQNEVVEAETARRVAGQRNALVAWMQQAGCHPAFIALVDVMIQESNEHGLDPRLCPVTGGHESTGGRGSSNLFGYICGNGADWETQIRMFCQQEQTNAGKWGCTTTDCWNLAYYWYGGGSPYGAGGVGDSAAYADSVVSDIQSIGW